MIEHFPISVPTVSELLLGVVAWAIFELILWAIVLLTSERVSGSLNAAGWLASASRSVAHGRAVTVSGVFLTVFLGRLALLPVVHVPAPKITDEFSQILASDTYASGRLTNPTHPLWSNFETFFVNQKPTYHSMYPPATGLFMAAAQAITGQPWYGMLFSVAAASAATCWMLLGWVPPRWALWGTLIFVLLATKARLTENYFGEGVIVLGGALVVGAVPRIVQRRSMAAAIWLSVGIALLVTTRPYEGFFLVSGISGVALWWARRCGFKPMALLKTIAPAMLTILMPVLLGVGYLNWRTTGHVLV